MIQAKAKQQTNPEDRLHSPASAAGTPPSSCCVPGSIDHFVQFYESDDVLIGSLQTFIEEGISSGDAVVVVTTDTHRLPLLAKLALSKIDIDSARARGQLIELDCSEILSRIMLAGMPVRGLLEDIARPLLEQTSPYSRVRLFGEMVAVLWEQGNHQAAIKLEKLWNEMLAGQATPEEQSRYNLFCAYPLYTANRADLGEPFREICAQHNRIIPGESYTSITDPEERLGLVALLQQQAGSATAEKTRHRQTQEELEILTGELAVQMEEMRRLREFSERLNGVWQVNDLLREVLSSAMSIHGADKGLLSICDTYWEETGHHPADSGNKQSNPIRASQGFSPALLQNESWIAAVHTGGTYLAHKQPVVVEDLRAEPSFSPYLELADANDLRASHCMPLTTRRGRYIGVLSLHFKEPHRPLPREISFTELYVRMAGDAIESVMLHHHMQQIGRAHV